MTNTGVMPTPEDETPSGEPRAEGVRNAAFTAGRARMGAGDGRFGDARPTDTRVLPVVAERESRRSRGYDEG